MVNLQHPTQRESSRLLLVDSSVLPEVFLRVVEAKRMLAVGQVRSLSEAAKAAGISRSALYKYKDCVFVHNEALDDQVITLSARLEDRPGVLSGLLNSLSEQQGNILTVNQNIPVDGVAAVSVSARLPLPIDGLMTDAPVDSVLEIQRALLDAAAYIGVDKKSAPLVALSFLALPVIPAIRLTDKGLFDSASFKFIEA